MAYRKGPTARRLVTSSMMSRDYNVILVTSQCSKSLHSETGTGINYPCGNFKHTLSIANKNQLIRLRPLVEEAFGVTVPQVKIAKYSVRLQFDGDEWVA